MMEYNIDELISTFCETEELINNNAYNNLDYNDDLKVGKILFTDYDTVKWDYVKEISKEDFFDLFERLINEEKVKETCVDLENGRLMFKLMDMNKLYAITLDEDEINNIKRGIPSRNIRILLTLFEHEKELSFKKKEELLQKAKDEENEKKKKEHERFLLKEARNGNVLNDEAKELYLSELKNKLKDNNLFKIFIRKFKIRLKNYFYDDILFGYLGLLGFGLLALFVGCVSLILFGVDLGLETIKIFSLITWPCWITPVVTMLVIIFNSFKDTLPEFKEMLEEHKLLKHKIKALESIHVPKEVKDIDLDNIMKEKQGEDINNKIRRITLLIERLSNESKQALAKELLNMLEQYQKDRSLLRKDGLVLETEEMIKKRFMVSLIDFEEKVNSELAKDEKIREFNDSVMQLEKMANPKKRIKTKREESSY